MRSARQRSHGQALVEFAITIPVLVMLMLGGADLARGFYYDLQVSGASRAGMRLGVQGTSTDLGDAIRSEPNSAISNDTTTWGNTGPGGANADCTSGSQKCGDTVGCVPSVFTGARTACFAVRTCTLTNGVCTSYGAWQSRPLVNSDAGGTNQALVVRTVYKLTPATPFISNFSTFGGSFYIIAETTGLELY
jgi:Flp pilus assembly protein TadG